MKSLFQKAISSLLIGLVSLAVFAQVKTQSYYNTHESEILPDARAAFQEGNYERTIELCKLHYIIVGNQDAAQLREMAERSLLSKNNQSDNGSLKEMTDRALSLAEYGDYDESLEVSLKVLKMTSDPEILSAIYDNIGFIYYSKNDLNKAADAYKRATELNPSNIMSTYNYGVMLYELGEYEKSTTVFKNFVNNNPQNSLTADAYAYLGHAQMSIGEANNARDSFLSSLKIKPNSSADLGLADYYASVKQPSLAAKYYEEGIAFEPSRPSNVKRLYQLGVCYGQSENIEKAKDAFRRCESLVGKLWADKKVQEAPEIADLFAEHMFYGTRSSVFLARLADNPTEMVREYTKVWGFHKSGIFDIRDYLNYSYMLVELGDAERAQTVVDEALALKPNNPDLLFLASQISNDSKKTIKLLSDILPQEYQYKPISFDYGTVYNNIAWAYHCSGESAKGLSFAEKAVKKNPEHAYSWETLGEIYYALERYSDCVDAMTKCLSCDDSEPSKTAYLYRGQSLIKLGKRREGQKDLKTADEM